MRRGCDGHEDRRRGAERCMCAEEDRDTADSGGGCGDGGRGREPQAESTGPAAGEREKGRRSTWAQESAEEATRHPDARRIVGTASRVGQKGQQTGSSIGMWYSDRAEREVLTGVNGRRRRGAALCPLACSTAPGLGLAALCVAGRWCIENIELSCAMFQTSAG